MELLHRIRIPYTESEIQLLFGDLSAIPPEHAVDLVIVSAFPGDYRPFPGTLFHAFGERGFDMGRVAEYKAVDLRLQLGCWISERLPSSVSEQMNFNYVLCFEPGYVSNQAQEIVANVFRCLNTFVIPDIKIPERRRESQPMYIQSVAMPVLATGNQQVRMERMLPALLDAAVFWVQNGLPLRTLKLVIHDAARLSTIHNLFAQFEEGLHNPGLRKSTNFSDRLITLIEQEGTEYFLEKLMSVADDDEKKVLYSLVQKAESSTPFQSPAAPVRTYTPGPGRYDYFISYSHTHMNEVQTFVTALQQAAPAANIFYDKTSIPAGAQWIYNISNAIQNADQFIAILSPAYSLSKMCWDEFQCAKLKEYKTGRSVIKAIRLYTETNTPLIIDIYNYIPCMEGDVQKLLYAARTI